MQTKFYFKNLKEIDIFGDMRTWEDDIKDVNLI